MKKELLIALTGFIFLIIISFIFSIYLGLGKAESDHDPASIWMYARRTAMILLAVILPRFSGKNIFSLLGYKLSLKWALITVAAGILTGFGNEGGFNPLIPVALILALFHAFAVEIYFRGYLFRFLVSSFKNPSVAIIFSGLATGISYLTEYPVWQFGIFGKIAFAGLFTALGSIYAYCYKKSDSFIVPWMMHFLGVLKYRMLF